MCVHPGNLEIRASQSALLVSLVSSGVTKSSDGVPGWSVTKPATVCDSQSCPQTALSCTAGGGGDDAKRVFPSASSRVCWWLSTPSPSDWRPLNENPREPLLPKVAIVAVGALALAAFALDSADLRDLRKKREAYADALTEAVVDRVEPRRRRHPVRASEHLDLMPTTSTKSLGLKQVSRDRRVDILDDGVQYGVDQDSADHAASSESSLIAPYPSHGAALRRPTR